MHRQVIWRPGFWYLLAVALPLLIWCGGCSSGSKSIAHATYGVSIDSWCPHTLAVGQTYHFSASIWNYSTHAYESHPVSWSISNNIGTFTGDGNFTALQTGTGKIAASYQGQTNTEDFIFTVTAPNPTTSQLSSLDISPGSASLTIGQTQAFTVTGYDQNNQVMTLPSVPSWSSTNSGIASVTPQGLCTAVAAGSCSIRVSCASYTAIATVTVATPTPTSQLSSLVISPSSAALTVGQILYFTVTGYDQFDQEMALPATPTWSSTNSSVASVNGVGRCTAQAAGTCSIHVTCSFYTATASVTVSAPLPVSQLSSLVISPSSTSLTVGQTQQFSVTGYDQFNQVMTLPSAPSWSTTDSSVASVTQLGLCTAQAAGSCSIRVTCGSCSATGAVTVSAPTPPPGGNVTGSDTMFLAAQNSTFTGAGAWKTWGITVSSSTNFVFRLAADYMVQAAIIVPGQLSNFTNNLAFSGYASFDRKFGTQSVTLAPGSYYVAVRNYVDGANEFSFELDYARNVTGASFYDIYFSASKYVNANGGWYYQPFTIQSGYAYFMDGCNSGMATYIINVSELTNFKNGNRFTYYTDYSSTSDNGAYPGEYQIKLPPGDYALCFWNSSAVNKAFTVQLDRYLIRSRGKAPKMAYALQPSVTGRSARVKPQDHATNGEVHHGE